MSTQTTHGKSSQPSINLKDTKILIVDDEDILAWSIDTELRALGADTTRAGSVREAIDRFHQFTPDVAITDLRLPDGNGLELLKKWRLELPDMPVILITAHGAIDSAITALRLGACDYLQKPFDMKDLLAAVGRATEIAKLRQKVSRLQGREIGTSEVKIVGDTPAMRQLQNELTRIAKSKAQTALILGESGSGKELAARAIHEWSDRAGHPFVEINCASIPETLLESELFGYEKGAFTDARERKLGLFEIARNGSIFLDEIGDMPQKLQAKLLRAIEYRRFKRLGSTKDIEFTGRIIAATHRNLLEEVAEKRFRADLYYRLSALPVHVPSLRERIEDLPRLVDFFLQKISGDLELRRPEVSHEALELLMRHDWPGNVRELKNVLERALVFYEPQVLEPGHLRMDAVPESAGRAAALPPSTVDVTPTEVKAPLAESSPDMVRVDQLHTHMIPRAGATSSLGAPISPHFSLTQELRDLPAKPEPVTNNFRLPASGLNLEELEKSLLTQALDQARHNQTRAAQLLGITRHTLRYRMEKHGLLAPHHGALA